MGPKMREALKVMESGRIFSSAELADLGIDRRVLRRLKEHYAIEQVKRGYYCVTEEYRNQELQADHSLEELAIGCALGGPDAFVCLYPAAHWHDLTVDTSYEDINIGLPHSRGAPTGEGTALYRFHRYRHEAALTVGIEIVGQSKGVDVRVTNRERTVVDLYRYSPMNGKQETANIVTDLDSATYAIKQYLSTGGTPAALIEMAARFGVEEGLGNILTNMQGIAWGAGDDDYEASSFRP